MSVCFLVFFVVGLLVYTPCMLRVAFLLPSFNKLSVFIYKKKKKLVEWFSSTSLHCILNIWSLSFVAEAEK